MDYETELDLIYVNYFENGYYSVEELNRALQTVNVLNYVAFGLELE